MRNRSGFSFAGESNTGLVRHRNEDSFLIAADPERSTALLAVADGVGGHRHGEIASYIICRELARAYFESSDAEFVSGVSALRFLEHRIGAINDLVFRRNFAERNPHPMSSTINVLLLTPEFGIMVNAGDSRLYRIAGGQAEQLSTDHTLAADKEIAQLYGKFMAPGCEHIISRSVGTRRELKLETQFIPRTPGEAFFLCSDGVYHDISTEQLAGLLTAGKSAGKIVDSIVRAVLMAGADDNLTVLCAYPHADQTVRSANFA